MLVEAMRGPYLAAECPKPAVSWGHPWETGKTPISNETTPSQCSWFGGAEMKPLARNTTMLRDLGTHGGLAMADGTPCSSCGLPEASYLETSFQGGYERVLGRMPAMQMEICCEKRPWWGIKDKASGTVKNSFSLQQEKKKKGEGWEMPCRVVKIWRKHHII